MALALSRPCFLAAFVVKSCFNYTKNSKFIKMYNGNNLVVGTWESVVRWISGVYAVAEYD